MKSRILTYRGGFKFPRTLQQYIRIPILKQDNSGFVGNQGDKLIVWGSTTIPDWLSQLYPEDVLNHPVCVANAVDKITALRRFWQNGIPTVEYTNDKESAQMWLNAGEIVYARTLTQAQSGRGIVIVSPGDELPSAKLYTKSIGPCREYRVHFWKEDILQITQKKRRVDRPDAPGEIKNWKTGWVYCEDDITPLSDEAIEHARHSVSALGLDFGAVDLATRKNQTYILEVNTAPGVEGRTIGKYVNKIAEFLGHERIF